MFCCEMISDIPSFTWLLEGVGLDGQVPRLRVYITQCTCGALHEFKVVFREGQIRFQVLHIFIDLFSS